MMIAMTSPCGRRYDILLPYAFSSITTTDRSLDVAMAGMRGMYGGIGKRASV